MPELYPIEEKTFETGEKSRLYVSLPRAEVVLRAGASERIRIAIEARGETLSKAQTLVEHTRLRMRLQGGTAKVEATPLPLERLHTWSALSSPVFRAQITLPTKCHVDASTSGGRLDAKGIHGHLVLRANGGALSGADLSGRVEVESYSGTVSMEDISGKACRVKCVSGRLNVNDVQTNESTWTLSNSQAEIDELYASSRFDLALSTCSVREVQGPVDAVIRRSEMALRLSKETAVEAKAVRGELSVEAPSSLSANLSLQGRRATIEGATDFEGSQSEQRIVGTVGGGGSPLSLRAIRGSARLAIGRDAFAAV